VSELELYEGKLEALARERGLDYFPVNFELVPGSFMMEVAIYGLPVRMPHWSFGVRYFYQLVQHRMGHSRLFEVVFPGNPGRAYLSKNNSPQENTLIVAHVLGHADFSKNNELFRRSQEEVGYNIVEKAAEHARRISDAAAIHGDGRVEAVLDAALSLAADRETISRLHFARALVSLGVVKDVRAAFRRYLGEGRRAFVRARWARLSDAIGWIRNAGGIAVLAHPARYGLRPGRLAALCREFKDLGGEGLEILSASHTPEEVARQPQSATGRFLADVLNPPMPMESAAG